MERELTPEQQKLKEQLAAEYGETNAHLAVQLFAVHTRLQSLARDDLTKEQRAIAYRDVKYFLARLHGALMPEAQALKVTECARRLGAAFALWKADDIEKRNGLPPLSE